MGMGIGVGVVTEVIVVVDGESGVLCWGVETNASEQVR